MKLEIDSYFEPDIAWLGEINRQTPKLKSYGERVPVVNHAAELFVRYGAARIPA